MIPEAVADVGLMLRRAQLLVLQDVLPGIECQNLTPIAYSALTLLDRHPGMRLYRLTELLAIRCTNCVTLITGLERRKLVRRDKVQSRGRAVALFLTEEGKAVLTQTDDEIGTRPDPLSDRLGQEDADRLLQLLRKLVESGPAKPLFLDR